MTDDQQRAAERNVQTAREVLVACNVQPQFVPTVVAAIAAALDEAEARGRDEVAAKVRWLADHIQALDVSHVKAPGLVARLRAIAPDLDEDES